MSEHIKIYQKFCDELKKRFALRGRLQEDQLKQPVSELLKNFARLYGKDLDTSTEEHNSEYKVRPDISVYIGKLICGHVELKNPQASVDFHDFTGRNLDQWERLSNLPNVLYANGHEWALYRSGDIKGEIIRFPKNSVLRGNAIVDAENVRKLEKCLVDFLEWKPNTPHEPSKLAEHLARLTRILRGEAESALKQRGSKVLDLRRDLGEFSTPDIESVDVADVIAQTVTYALLLARLEGAENLTSNEASNYLSGKNEVLKVLLELFAKAEKELETGFELLQRSLESLDVNKFSKTSGIGLYFYEDFLKAYDPKLSKDKGIYYTPKEIVRLQARLAEEILEEHFGKAEGFASKNVVLLDPAVGTGAYLIEALHQGMERIAEWTGKAEVPAYAREMMKNMHGIESLVGPYIVAHIQLSKAFLEYQTDGVDTSDIKPNIYLGDTLSSPYQTLKGQGALFYESLTEEQEKVRRIKTDEEILVCLGNPPYDRQNIRQDDANKHRKGGWVRFRDNIQGGKKSKQRGEPPILDAFLRPAKDRKEGIHLKSLYNDYVYFWRWALWRLFEQQRGGGIISFITASSYLRGPGFVGMREEMRRAFDELWIFDLGGDSIGARKSANVFAIRTPVAIAIGYSSKEPQRTKPAQVRYVRIPGEKREEKLQALEKIKQLDDKESLSALGLEWRDCPQEWHAHFTPAGTGAFFDYPTLKDLFPWDHSGVLSKRTWIMGETEEVLEKRWKRLVEAPAEERAELFRETRDRKITHTTKDMLPGGNESSIRDIDSNAPTPPVQTISYRSFDNQFALVDTRVCDYLRPDLWHSLSDKQVFFTFLKTEVFGKGPAISVTPYLPDMDHFRGRGGRTAPLYRDKEAKEPNITHGLLKFLTEKYQYKTDISPEDLAAYIYAILGGRSYTRIFWDELENPGARIPITKDVQLFKRASERGKELIWLHTYAQRFKDKKQNRNNTIPKGKARIVVAITEYPDKFSYDSTSKEISIGNGRIGPVDSEVWNYEISGLKVLQSWLGYRMKKPRGKRSSELNKIRPQQWSRDMNKNLRELIWILEETLNMEPDLESILRAVIKSECFSASELPKPSKAQKKPPRPSPSQSPLLNKCYASDEDGDDENN